MMRLEKQTLVLQHQNSTAHTRKPKIDPRFLIRVPINKVRAAKPSDRHPASRDCNRVISLAAV